MLTNKMIGGALIVAGTCVGASLLALPIATAHGNFYATLSLFLASWAIMTLAGFLVLEVSMWLQHEDINMISMAKITLGVPGEVIAWLSFLLLLYTANSAYLAGGTDLLSTAASKLWGIKLSELQVACGLALIGGLIIYLGTTVVDQLNRLFMVGLFVTFFVLIYFLMPHINLEEYHDTKGFWSYPIPAIPVIVAAFAYQFVIPSLKTYLHGNVKKLVYIIILGGLIPLVMNLLWQIMVTGSIPLSGPYSLQAIERSGDAVSGLSDAISHLHGVGTSVALYTRLFAMCALVTSFLGVTLSLVDFLADGLNIKKNHRGRFILVVMSIAPPLFFAIYYPKGFVLALNYAGTFVAILLGILPAAMVYSGRYIKKLDTNAPFRTPGGILPIILVFSLSAVMIGANIYERFIA